MLVVHRVRLSPTRSDLLSPWANGIPSGWPATAIRTSGFGTVRFGLLVDVYILLFFSWNDLFLSSLLQLVWTL
jgi:hypothetical protein